MTQGATIYIVDDDAAMRDSLALLLGLKGFQTQIFASAENLLQAYNEEWLGCILVDVRMSGLTGLELQAELRSRECDLPVFLMSAYGDVSTARAALKAGAADFLEKPIDDDVLIDALRSAIDAHTARRKAAPLIKGINRPQQLTMREQQVLDLVAAGFQVKQIAGRLGISPRTVEVYKSRMSQKLRANEPGGGSGSAVGGPGPTADREAD